MMTWLQWQKALSKVGKNYYLVNNLNTALQCEDRIVMVHYYHT